MFDRKLNFTIVFVLFSICGFSLSATANDETVDTQTEPASLASRNSESAFFVLPTDVLFDFNKASLSEQGIEIIRDITAKIRDDFSSPVILLTGHTDRLGSEKNNQKMSVRRAKSIRQLMVTDGLNGSQIRTQGFGEHYPLVECVSDNEAELIRCLAENRRVEIEVSEADAVKTHQK